MVMNEKRRCSILFHLLVPGGKWQTVIGSLSSSASFCKLDLPQAHAIAVAAAAVGGDHQALGYRDGASFPSSATIGGSH